MTIDNAVPFAENIAFVSAIRHVQAVDRILGSLHGLSKEEQATILLEAHARLMIVPGIVAGSSPSKPKLHEAVSDLLKAAPKGGLSGREILTKAASLGLNRGSVAAQLSVLSNTGKILRTGERGSFRYSLK